MRTTVVIALAFLLTSVSSVSHARTFECVQADSLEQASASAQATTQAKPVALVNLNTATAQELETLPGVGPAMAARIIEYRAKQGGFKKIEDLMSVRGIGEKAFLKLKPMVVVTPGKGLGW